MAGHFSYIADLERTLSDRQLSILYHKYDDLTFGSWDLELGTSHKRLKFSYDGKEEQLHISSARLGSQAAQPKWVQAGSLKVLRNDISATVLAEIDEFFAKPTL